MEGRRGPWASEEKSRMRQLSEAAVSKKERTQRSTATSPRRSRPSRRLRGGRESAVGVGLTAWQQPGACTV